MKKVQELTGGGRVLGMENIRMHSALVIVIGNILGRVPFPGVKNTINTFMGND